MPYISKRIVSQSGKDKQFYRQFEKPKLSFNAACIKSIKFLERLGRQGKELLPLPMIMRKIIYLRVGGTYMWVSG